MQLKQLVVDEAHMWLCSYESLTVLLNFILAVFITSSVSLFIMSATSMVAIYATGSNMQAYQMVT